MARKARIKNDFGVFYISQKSGTTRHIFECDNDREQFLTILEQSQKKFQFKLYAFCIQSPDEYHLVMDVNGGDLSKIMKTINISYAMYAKCNDKLYKDRFKSKVLESESEIVEIVNSIHKRYKNQSLWNSFCTYNGLIPLKIILQHNLPTKNNCQDCIRTILEAKDKLSTIALRENKSINDIFKDKNYRNQLICDFRKHSTLSLKDLGKVFGGLSESTICKILNQ